MSTFQAIYSDEQRAALAEAYEDRCIRPAHKVVTLAQAGELAPGLPAFNVPGGANTVRDMARRLRRQRAGQVRSDLASMPPRDALEALRRRMVNLADHLTAEAEKAARSGKLDPKRTTEIARLLREIAAIPGPNDARPVKPGDKIPGGQGAKNGERTRSGPAAAMLAELRHRAPGVETATAPQPTHSKQSEDAQSEAHAATNTAAHSDAANQHDTQHALPDSWARQQVAGLAARSH